MTTPRSLALFLTLPILLYSAGARKPAAICGSWRFNEGESTEIAAWGDRVLHLDIRSSGDSITIVHDWRHPSRGSWTESVTVTPDGESVKELVESAVWPGNWFVGVLTSVGSEKITQATWRERDRVLVTETEQVVEVSQGVSAISSTFEYALDRNGDTLTLTERRSTRPTPVMLVFDRVVDGSGE